MNSSSALLHHTTLHISFQVKDKSLFDAKSTCLLEFAIFLLTGSHVAKGKTNTMDQIMDFIGRLQPNCERALNLVETGISRPLTLTESVQLQYNRNLCPYCACKKEKFGQKMAKYQDVKRSR